MTAAPQSVSKKVRDFPERKSVKEIRSLYR